MHYAHHYAAYASITSITQFENGYYPAEADHGRQHGRQQRMAFNPDQRFWSALVGATDFSSWGRAEQGRAPLVRLYSDRLRLEDDHLRPGARVGCAPVGPPDGVDDRECLDSGNE